MAKRSVDERAVFATTDDIRRILGSPDETKLLEIAGLRPTIRDVEEASLWLGGDADVFGSGQPLKPLPGEIVAILTADEEEPRSGP